MRGSIAKLAAALLAIQVVGVRAQTGQLPAAAPVQTTVPRPATASPISKIRSWGYQLQKVDPGEIAGSPYDLVVIDYAHSEDDRLFNRDDLRQMQKKPDGSRRFVLAYLSVGEAESYRFYWNSEWVEPLQVAINDDGSIIKPDEPSADRNSKPNSLNSTQPAATSLRTKTVHVPRLWAPAWLGRENENWPENFRVRYWEKGWQDIVFGTQKSYLEQIMAAGFDGVYLDRVDAFYDIADERPSAKSEMVALVADLARHARKIQPGFVIVPQNGEELLQDPTYLNAIDGIAKENLLYGSPTEGQPSEKDWIADSKSWLAPARKLDLPVMVVEYTLDKGIADQVVVELGSLGYIPYFGVKSLDRLIVAKDLLRQAQVVPPASGPAGTTPTTPLQSGTAPGQPRTSPDTAAERSSSRVRKRKGRR